MKSVVNTIICGEALKILKSLPSEFIDCVVTSPPYWALRDYGSEVESIWDGDKDCEHEFELIERKDPMDRNGSGDHEEGGKAGHWEMKTTKSGFCSKCGAWKGQLGLEPTYELYIKHLCNIFGEIKRVLKQTGTCWVNIGDTYGGSGNASGHKEDTKNLGYTTSQIGATRGITKKLMSKSLTMIPFRFAIEMVNRSWILRNTIIWHKPNCMPSSAKDRFTVDFEYIFFFTKNKKYWFERQLEGFNRSPKTITRAKYPRYVSNKPKKSDIRTGQPDFLNRIDYDFGDSQGGRNKRTVWTICPQPFPEAHFAVYPEQLIEIPIKAGCPKNGIVLDPFIGSGTTALVALKQNKRFIGIELNPDYVKMGKKRIRNRRNGKEKKKRLAM